MQKMYFCLKKNIKNPCIDKIILFNEREYSKELGVDSDKVEQIVIKKGFLLKMYLNFV